VTTRLPGALGRPAATGRAGQPTWPTPRWFWLPG